MRVYFGGIACRGIHRFVAGLELGHRRDTTKDGVTASSTRSRRCIQLMTIRSGNGIIPRTPSYASVEAFSSNEFWR